MKLINPDYNMMSSDDNFNNGALHPNKPQKHSPNSHSLGNISALNNGLKPINVTTTDDIFLMRKKSRSREAINLGSHSVNFPQSVPIPTDLKLKNSVENNGILTKSNIPMNGTPNQSNSANDSDIIVTTARPATIISSTGNHHSPLNDENILHINEDAIKSSPRKINQNTNSPINGNKTLIMTNGQLKKMSKDADLFVPPRSLPLIPDTKDVDWSSLVDSAITQINEGLKKHYYDSGTPPQVGSMINNTNGNGVHVDRQHGKNSPSYESISSTSSSSSSSGGNRGNGIQSSLPDLQNQVTQLEDRITKETRRRKSLEHAVRKLTEENRRLQDESHAAVQQLRRFSEWFFQTVDRQA